MSKSLALEAYIPQLYKQLRNWHLDEQQKNYFLEHITNSQTWILPESVIDMFSHTAVDVEALKGVRLPYPKVTIATHVPLKQKNFNPTLNAAACERVYILQESEDTLYMSLIIKHNGTWGPLPYVGIPFSALDDTNTPLVYWDAEKKANGINIKNLDLSGITSMTYDPTQVTAILRDIVEDLIYCLLFMQVTACSNIEVLNSNSPSLLQKRNTGKNKYCPKKYRHFKIFSEPEVQVRTTQTNTGNHRNSPKPHWRKGHIRMQPTNKGVVRKWIKPTLIGGMSAKPTPVKVTM